MTELTCELTLLTTVVPRTFPLATASTYCVNPATV